VEGIYMNKTKIDWCDSTWNPVTGCLHGCEYCYARGIANRFGCHATPDDKVSVVIHPWEDSETGRKLPYPYDFSPTLHKYRLNEYEGKKGRNIFVCSMADLFGKWVPDSWIEEVFKACEKAPQHNYIFLTKNPWRYADLAKKGILPKRKNMWYGYSYTGQEHEAKGWWNDEYNIFISMEPLLDNICTTLSKWIIIGAETGRRKDKVIPKREWVEEIVESCKKKSIPVFMKSSLADIWGEPLIQEFPKELIKNK
jgi:protein gp37